MKKQDVALIIFVILGVVLAGIGAFAGLVLAGLGHASAMEQAYPFMLTLSLLLSSPAIIAVLVIIIWKLIARLRKTYEKN